MTPAQAALLVTDVVDQLELAQAEGCHPTSLRGDAVMVSESGQLTIECTGNARSWDEVHDAVAGLLRQIATNGRGAALADRLDEAIADSSDLADLVRRVRLAAATEFDPSEVERRRSQIAALVSTVMGRARPETPVVEPADVPIQPLLTTGSSLASNGWHPPAGKVWHRKKRRPSRRRGILVLVALLLLIGMVWAAPKAWSELNRGWHTLLDPVESSMQNQISPVSPPPPVPEVAPPPEAGAQPGPVHTAHPAAAGPITQVAATFANGACEAGRSCTMRVDVGVDPGANVAAVTWNLTVYDRCTGVVQPGGDVTVPVPPGAREAYGIGNVALPPDSALAVAAVTTAPAASASEPVYVPAENATCSDGSPRAGG
ncbi:hypothetical protein F8M49_14050 [Rhodococcus zopfii]|uniref:Uncharacterized protein n=1 Tax=Rhodococcus zopfii TaxID=43772 RepID=A0ABU3WQB6_9NOCA|nr:hypothetical protein [Rhodococcus zopfii]